MYIYTHVFICIHIYIYIYMSKDLEGLTRAETYHNMIQHDLT